MSMIRLKRFGIEIIELLRRLNKLIWMEEFRNRLDFLG